MFLSFLQKQLKKQHKYLNSYKHFIIRIYQARDKKGSKIVVHKKHEGIYILTRELHTSLRNYRSNYIYGIKIHYNQPRKKLVSI